MFRFLLSLFAKPAPRIDRVRVAQIINRPATTYERAASREWNAR